MGGTKLIIDTDMAGGGCQDCDDVGTLCMANAMADTGEVDLLAVVSNSMADEATATIQVLQKHYGRDVPIGVYKGPLQRRQRSLDDNFLGVYGGPHLKWVHPYAQRFATTSELARTSQLLSNDELPSSVDVYRSVLAAQEDQSVVIASIGLLTNLAALLRSEPDAHSPLSGQELVSSKVRLLAIMGGRYPSGDECNFCECNIWEGGCATTSSSQFVTSNLPATLRVIYLGQEVGFEVMHGGALSSCTREGNPCREPYVQYLFGPHRDRFSWDPLTVLGAVRGFTSIPAFSDSAPGYNAVEWQGINSWQENWDSKQTYIVLSEEEEKRRAAGKAIDELLCQTPAQVFREQLTGPPVHPHAVHKSQPSVVCIHSIAAVGVVVANAEYENDYESAGAWGGTCTCPNGQTTTLETTWTTASPWHVLEV